MKKIILATGNQGKVFEFQDLLKDSFEFQAQSEFGVEEVEETGLSFVENAILKARNAAKHTNQWAIADDSGLAVDVLDGSPGIYSARYAGVEATDEKNVGKLLKNLENETNRKAYFYCAIVLVKHHLDPTPIIALGQWNGEILKERQGKNGFGYDPVFYVPELQKSSAQLTQLEKNNISHRGLALKQLLKQI
jgi:XTP/dITP diphosphohydrolase